MNDKIQKAFNGQINAEFYSAYLYLSMSAYFEGINLRGFANWLKVQAQEEVTHAMRFYNHIVERGGKVTLKAIEGPKTQWKTPLEAFKDAYKHEVKVTGMINGLVELSAAEKDYASNSILQWFVDEQVEEEASTDEVVQKLKLINNMPGPLFILDKELGGRTFNQEER